MNLKLLLTIHLVFTGCVTALSQYYPVHEHVLHGITENDRVEGVHVKSFSISHQITVREFNTYLKSVKKDSSSSFFNAQIPSSREIPKKMVTAILSDPKLQDQPMPGISWIVARNYCQWLTAHSTAGYEYDLPLLSELVAFENIYNENANNVLECWTLNSYDESIYEFTKAFDYQYIAKASDPPAMKRKVIHGGSYHMHLNTGGISDEREYEYQDSSSRYVGFRVVRKMKNVTSYVKKSRGIDVSFGLKNNQLEGVYCEMDENGILKTLGSFSNGQRSGIWTTWDAKGEIKIQRNYQNNKEFEKVFPLVANPYEDVYTKFPVYVLKKNNQKFYPYFHVEERAVVFSQRLWRELNSVNESDLFKAVDFKELVQKLIESETKWYHYGRMADFKKEILNDERVKLLKEMDQWDFSRIEVKEDFFFSADQLQSDTRQVALSFYKNKDDKQPSYTVYFPWVRSVLATVNVKSIGLEEVQTLDDLFFFHAYRGRIVNTSSFRNNSEEEILVDDHQLEIEKFVIEHRMWEMFGR